MPAKVVTKQVNILLPLWQYKELQRICKAEDRTASAVIRRALKQYCARAESD